MSSAETPSNPIRCGKYELLERIGEGGMAEVFRARLPGAAGFEKILVIKRILPHLAKKPDFVRMFVDEAKLAAQVQHQNVVQVFELGETNEGELYMAMEYVPGVDLRRLLVNARERRLRIPVWFVLHTMAEVLNGLTYAHELCDHEGRPLHVVHRDVTPGNVFISYQGEVKLADFGIAKAVGRVSETEAGQVKGNAPFMAPEAIYGRTLDARADVFSAGVVLWASLALRLPFEGASNYETAKLVCEAKREPPSKYNPLVTADLDQVALQALEIERARRIPSAREFQARLLEILARLRPKLLPSDVRHVVDVLTGRKVPDAQFSDQRPPSVTLRRDDESADILDVHVTAPAPAWSGPHAPRPARGDSSVAHAPPLDRGDSSVVAARDPTLGPPEPRRPSGGSGDATRDGRAAEVTPTYRPAPELAGDLALPPPPSRTVAPSPWIGPTPGGTRTPVPAAPLGPHAPLGSPLGPLGAQFAPAQLGPTPFAQAPLASSSLPGALGASGAPLGAIPSAPLTSTPLTSAPLTSAPPLRSTSTVGVAPARFGAPVLGAIVAPPVLQGAVVAPSPQLAPPTPPAAQASLPSPSVAQTASTPTPPMPGPRESGELLLGDVPLASMMELVRTTGAPPVELQRDVERFYGDQTRLLVRFTDGSTLPAKGLDECLSLCDPWGRRATAVSLDGVAWLELGPFARLAGLDYLAPDTSPLKAVSFVGQLEERSLSSVFIQLSRARATGRLVIMDKGVHRVARREIDVQNGAPVYVYADLPALQFPQLVVQHRLVKRELIADLVLQVLKTRLPIEEVARRNAFVDLNPYRPVFMRDRLAELFTWRYGRFAFDTGREVRGAQPFAPSLVRVLPDAVQRGYSVEELVRDLEAQMNVKLRRADSFDAVLTELALKDKHASAAKRLGQKTALAAVLKKYPAETHAILTMARILLDLEVLLPA